MIRKLLIANRGEIACRIIRTCREMGIATVAVYSDADTNALHVEMADEAIHIGASPATESYLNINKIIDAAKRAGADSIHPGYGFLAENAEFAYRVIAEDLTFIGPPPGAMEAMGRKQAAKLLLQGVPLVPGYIGDEQSDEVLIAEAQKTGFPLMVKASAGGGGKGMRQVDSPEDLPDALAVARREAMQAFGVDVLILEKVIVNPRHIEVQIFGDQRGNIIALGERECTIQRRHQKIIEETPSDAVDDDLRARMFAAAVSVGEQIGYYSAGTVEFLVDEDGEFYFMEMNTRLQVEHPVTEMVFGIDLVRWQLLVSEGYPLPAIDLQPNGHAIEARVYAEDPTNGFLPVTGKILHWQADDSVRVDTGVRTGDDISVYYDPMIAKVIAHAETRIQAIRRLDYALANLQLLGLRNNIAFLRRVLMNEDHLVTEINTNFVAEHPELLILEDTVPEIVLVSAAVAQQPGTGHFRNNPNRPIRHTFRYRDADYAVLLTPQKEAGIFSVEIDAELHLLNAMPRGNGEWTMILNGHRQHVVIAHDDDYTWWVFTQGGTYALKWISPLPLPGTRAESAGSLRAPMPGQVVTVLVEVGQQVEQGTLLMTLEAMKMEHRIEAPYAGIVDKIYYKVGDPVQAEAILLEMSALANER